LSYYECGIFKLGKEGDEMEVFNLKDMEPEEKAEVFYKTDEFNIRIIELSAGVQVPDCDMEAYVLFYVVGGNVKVTVDGGRNA